MPSQFSSAQRIYHLTWMAQIKIRAIYFFAQLSECPPIRSFC